MVCTFLNVWKRLLFGGGWFCRCAIKRLGHAFRLPKCFHKWRPNSIYSACSFTETLEKLLLLCAFPNTQSTSKSKSALFSVFRPCATCPKVTLVSSGTNTSATLRENREGSVCCCCFSRMTESRPFERLSVFLERTIDFQNFPEKYGTAVTVSMYANSDHYRHIFHASQQSSIMHMLKRVNRTHHTRQHDHCTVKAGCITPYLSEDFTVYAYSSLHVCCASFWISVSDNIVYYGSL